MKGETMRLYRGKRKDNNEWVYGWYALKPEVGAVILTDMGETYDSSPLLVEIPVHPSTVGQQVGKQDKHKKEIYKGDKVILMTHWDRGDMSKNKYREEIATKDCSCGLNTNGMVSIQHEGQKEYEPQLEIIGNIHTNPDRLENRNEQRDKV